eukprot:1490-Heterococcus_DN1.PRE.4
MKKVEACARAALSERLQLQFVTSSVSMQCCGSDLPVYQQREPGQACPAACPHKQPASQSAHQLAAGSVSRAPHSTVCKRALYYHLRTFSSAVQPPMRMPAANRSVSRVDRKG